MKKLAILILALATFCMAKEIEIDAHNTIKAVYVSNETVHSNIYCRNFNDTATTKRCSMEKTENAYEFRLKITEYKCPEFLTPAPLAQYVSTEMNVLEFFSWAVACGKAKNLSVHSLKSENGKHRIEFLKRSQPDNITFMKAN